MSSNQLRARCSRERSKLSLVDTQRTDLTHSFLFPFLGTAAIFSGWLALVHYVQIPHYILPSPTAVVTSLVNDWHILGPALWVTTTTTLSALFLALFGGVLIAVVLLRARWIEMFLSPLFVFLQITPVVAIAPLLLIYAPTPTIAQLSCAFIVTFFPIVANTLHGLKSANRHLAETVQLYTDSKWKMLFVLQFPSALPSMFTGLKVGGGLALVGTVVAEFSAGSAGAGSGLAFRLLEAQYRLNTPRLFAALVLLAFLGLTIYLLVHAASRITLRHWYATKAIG